MTAISEVDASSATDQQNQWLTNLKQKIGNAVAEEERKEQAAAANTASLGIWYDNSSNPIVELNVKSINNNEAVISLERTRGKNLQYSVSTAQF